MSDSLNPIRITQRLFRETNRRTAVSLLIYYLGVTGMVKNLFCLGFEKDLERIIIEYFVKVTFIFE